MSRRNKPSFQTSLMLSLLTIWHSISGLFQLVRRSPSSKSLKTTNPKIRVTKLRRSFFLGIITFILTISLSGLDLWLPRPAYAAGLYIEPITWDFVGLDSNNVNVGPNNFLLAARVCNINGIGGSPLTNINVQYQRIGAFNPFITVTAINGVNIDTVSIPSLPSGVKPPNHQQVPNSGAADITPSNCFDAYFNIVVARNSAAYRTVQQYRLVASAAGAGSVDTNTALASGITGYTYGTPVSQQIYVEKILSQARNEVISFVGPSNVFVGDTVEYVLTTKTATAYPQLTVSTDFPNGLIQLVDVKTTYSSDPAAVSSGVYYDACGWIADPSNVGYNTSADTCNGPVANQDPAGAAQDGKVGNNVITRYRVKVLSTGLGNPTSNTVTVNHLINDFSGGSFHYNADYGSGLGTSQITINSSTTDLQIVKSHTGNFATGNNTYNLVVTNNGPLAARGLLRIVDTLPAGFTYVSASTTGPGLLEPWTCTATGQTVSCTNPNTNTFAVGESSTLNLVVNVAPTAAALSLNTAVLSSNSPDSNLANNSSTDPTTVIKGTNIVLLKDDSVADPTEQTFVAGSTATYILTATNTSGFDALGPLTIIDTLPTGLSFSSATGTGWTCSANGQNVTCTNPSGLATGNGTTTGITTLNITVNVLSNVSPSVTNTASLTSGSLDTNPSDNTNITQTNPTTKPVPDLIVSKTDNDQSFVVSQNGTYTITVRNQGAFATTGIITVTDTLPASFTFVSATSAAGSSGWTCSAVSSTVTCTNPNSLAINNSSSILLTVTPTTITGSPFTNNVSVALPAGEETVINNNTGSDTTPVLASGAIDLNVVKKLTLVGALPPSPACTTVGQVDTCTATIAPNTAIQYQITVTNNTGGNGADTNIRLTDVIPPEITGATWTCTFGGLNPTDLGVGANAANNGNYNSCTGATTEGTTPFNIHKSSGSGNINISTISLRKNNGSGTNGGKVVITVNGTTASSGFSGIFSNSATAIPSTGADATIADNTYTVNATIRGADLSLTKTNVAPFIQGQNGIYRLTITNTGTPALPTTDLITVTDTLPAGLTFVSASSASGSSGWSCSYASATRLLTCNNPAILASGATTQIDIIVTPTVTGSITNSATVNTEGDTNAANNTGSVTNTIITPDPDVRITKTAGTLNLGQSGTYTLQIDNIGTTTAIAPIVVTDTLPAGLNFTSGTGTGWICSASGQVVTCTNFSNIAAGASAPALTLNVLVGTQTASSITNIANVAQVTGEAAGKLANNDTSLVSSVAQVADLAVVKTRVGNLIQGQNVTYNLLVTNNGPSSVPNASNITVTDTLPNNLEFVSSTGGGFTCTAPAKVDGNTVGTQQVVTCTRTTGLVIGTSATITLNVLVRNSTPLGSVTNTAVVSGLLTDPVTTNNTSNDTGTVTVFNADLKLTKRTLGPFVINSQGTYSLAVENLGPALATGTLTITDSLPNNLAFASSVGEGWTCSAPTKVAGTEQLVTCTNPNATGLAVGSITAVNITVNIGTGTPVGTNSITNTANLNIPAYDLVPANNTASAPTTINDSADLSITKTTGSTFIVGQQAVYTIRVTNNSLSTSVAPLTLTDQLPTGLSYVSATGTNWTCPASSTDPDVVCTYNVDLLSGTSTSDLTFTVNVVDFSPSANPATYTNFVSVYGPTPDPNTDNNTAQVTSNRTNPAPSLNLVKRITAINGATLTGFVDGTDAGLSNDNDAKWPSPNTQYLRGAIACNAGNACNTVQGVKPGDNVEYTIYFLSNGSDNLRNVKICDRIPTNTTFQPDTFGAANSGLGMLLGWNSSGSGALADPTNSTLVANIKLALTNIVDSPTPDQGRFYSASAGSALPNPACGAAANANGGMVVDLGASIVPQATGAGTPVNSYGFVRFNVQVN